MAFTITPEKIEEMKKFLQENLLTQSIPCRTVGLRLMETFLLPNWLPVDATTF